MNVATKNNDWHIAGFIKEYLHEEFPQLAVVTQVDSPGIVSFEAALLINNRPYKTGFSINIAAFISEEITSYSQFEKYHGFRDLLKHTILDAAIDWIQYYITKNDGI